MQVTAVGLRAFLTWNGWSLHFRSAVPSTFRSPHSTSVHPPSKLSRHSLRLAFTPTFLQPHSFPPPFRGLRVQRLGYSRHSRRVGGTTDCCSFPDFARVNWHPFAPRSRVCGRDSTVTAGPTRGSSLSKTWSFDPRGRRFVLDELIGGCVLLYT